MQLSRTRVITTPFSALLIAPIDSRIVSRVRADYGNLFGASARQRSRRPLTKRRINLVLLPDQRRSTACVEAKRLRGLAAAHDRLLCSFAQIYSSETSKHNIYSASTRFSDDFRPAVLTFQVDQELQIVPLGRRKCAEDAIRVYQDVGHAVGASELPRLGRLLGGGLLRPLFLLFLRPRQRELVDVREGDEFRLLLELLGGRRGCKRVLFQLRCRRRRSFEGRRLLLRVFASDVSSRRLFGSLSNTSGDSEIVFATSSESSILDQAMAQELPPGSVAWSLPSGM
ncbi:hypothetical protein L596_013970 [Steinernema carpocapsae]|uniref:Uncharacterized protein n=1 Tax=Steinernema carpocapsae TaxID=34508 RepID=A0A4U5NBF4_STECR|nr:hypothetical protein L596_013970 [Steinernema carpocapsae]